MMQIWDTLLYQPLFNLLVFIYNLVGGDIGIAIIVLTILLKVVLAPLSHQSLKSQHALQQMQPKVEELKIKFKDQKEVLSQELMKLYKTEKVNPFSSCLPILIQLPFLIALYQVFSHGLASQNLDILYSFVQNPGQLNNTFFGWWDLTKPSWPLAVLTGAAQYWQSKSLLKKPTGQTTNTTDTASMMNKQMLYIMPAVTVFFGFSLPGGLILYWLVNTLLTVGQQYWSIHRHEPKL